MSYGSLSGNKHHCMRIDDADCQDNQVPGQGLASIASLEELEHEAEAFAREVIDLRIRLGAARQDDPQKVSRYDDEDRKNLDKLSEKLQAIPRRMQDIRNAQRAITKQQQHQIDRLMVTRRVSPANELAQLQGQEAELQKRITQLRDEERSLLDKTQLMKSKIKEFVQVVDASIEHMETDEDTSSISHDIDLSGHEELNDVVTKGSNFTQPIYIESDDEDVVQTIPDGLPTSATYEYEDMDNTNTVVLEITRQDIIQQMQTRLSKHQHIRIDPKVVPNIVSHVVNNILGGQSSRHPSTEKTRVSLPLNHEKWHNLIAIPTASSLEVIGSLHRYNERRNRDYRFSQRERTGVRVAESENKTRCQDLPGSMADWITSENMSEGGNEPSQNTMTATHSEKIDNTAIHSVSERQTVPEHQDNSIINDLNDVQAHSIKTIDLLNSKLLNGVGGLLKPLLVAQSDEWEKLNLKSWTADDLILRGTCLTQRARRCKTVRLTESAACEYCETHGKVCASISERGVVDVYPLRKEIRNSHDPHKVDYWKIS